MRYIVVALLVASWAAVANAAPSIDVGNFNLLPQTAGQQIILKVTGGDAVTGFSLRAQINDGTGPQNEPVFQAINFSGGTIWDLTQALRSVVHLSFPLMRRLASRSTTPAIVRRLPVIW